MDPLHQFHIQPIVSLFVGGLDLSFSNSALWMLISAIAVFGLMELGLRGATRIPGRLQSLVEMLYQLVAKTVTDNAGPEAKSYVPFVFTLFSFVLAGNLMGLIPGAFTFTSHLAVTFALALMVFLIVLGIGFYKNGVGYIQIFYPAGAPIWLAPLLVPIEVLSFFARPISLGVRLFANMMAGHTMMKVFAGFSVMALESLGAAGLVVALGAVAINVALTGLETLVAFLQAYVFMILSSLYLKDALHMEH